MAAPMPGPTRLRSLLFAVFALSGFSGLVYESIWSHYLGLFLGHAAYAQTLVLAIYMGGMAVGAWAAGRFGPRWGNLLRGYALAEAAIGLLAIGFHPLFICATDLTFEGVVPRLGSTAAVAAWKWGLGAILILPQSILLGTTFPLMSAGLIRRAPLGAGATLATLYFANSLGGALGVLASGFLLVGALGLPGTIGLAGAVNVALALVVWRLAGGEGGRATPAPGDARSPDRGWVRILLAVSLLTGASSFAYEIGWIRLLSMVLGASTHSFELMLSAFVLGLAAGSLWIRRRIDAARDPVRLLAWMQLAMGALALATLPVYGRTFHAVAWILARVERSDLGYLLFAAGSHGLALAVMLPATFCAGTTLPLVTRALLRAGHGEPSIGSAYAANTVGAVVGVFAALHLGLPLLGLKGTIVAGAATDLGLGVLLLWRASAGSRAPALLAAAGGGALLLLAAFTVRLDPLLMASGVFRTGTLPEAGELRVLQHRDGATATVALTTDAGDFVALRTNGKADAAIHMSPGPPSADQVTMVLLGALPQLLRPDAKAAANVGFGSGLTTHTLLASRSLEVVDTIEIEPAIVAVARGFLPRNARAYDDPRSRIRYEDAKSFFAGRATRYDVIVSEPSNPWVSGVAGLFSREFYRVAAGSLAEGGIFVQWLPLYELSDELAASVLKALSEAFADWQVFLANETNAVIVASASRIPPLDPSAFGNPGLAEDLGHVWIRGVQDVEIRRAGDRRTLAPWLATHATPANSDYWPVLDQGAARARFLAVMARALPDLAAVPLPMMEMLGAVDPRWSRTEVSMTPLLPRARAAHVAAAFRDAVAAADPKALGRLPPTGDDAVDVPVRRLLLRCARPGESRTGALFALAVEVVPYLRPGELEEVWRSLGRWPCVAGAEGEEAAWLALLRALGARDARRTLGEAVGLLDGGAWRSREQATYLVAVSLLGALAAGDGEAATGVWERFRAEFPDGGGELLFRFLGAATEAERRRAVPPRQVEETGR